MCKQAIGAMVVLALLAAASGCNVCRAIVYDPFGPNTLCDGRRCSLGSPVEICGPGCEEPCAPGPIRGRCGLGREAATPCDEDCCDECGEVVCRHRGGILRGPLWLVFALFRAGSYCGCGESWGGCGPRYWGDWYGDPPECCDPCDQYGNFTGGNVTGWGGPVGEAVAAMPAPSPQPGASASGGGCRRCGQADQASSYSPYSPRAPATRMASRPSPYASTQQGSSQYRSPYAPRILSTTDRVVKPATAGQTPHLAQPRPTTVVQ